MGTKIAGDQLLTLRGICESLVYHGRHFAKSRDEVVIQKAMQVLQLRKLKCKVYNKYDFEIIPYDAVNIMRPSKWGNRYIIGKDGTRDEVCDRYEKEKLKDKKFLKMVKKELKGKDLLCCCKPKRCHGDFLLRIANADSN